MPRGYNLAKTFFSEQPATSSRADTFQPPIEDNHANNPKKGPDYDIAILLRKAIHQPAKDQTFSSPDLNSIVVLPSHFAQRLKIGEKT